jgi:hypothetical protein
LDSSGLEYDPAAGFFGFGKGSSDSITVWEYLRQVTDPHLLREDSVSWSESATLQRIVTVVRKGLDGAEVRVTRIITVKFTLHFFRTNYSCVMSQLFASLSDSVKCSRGVTRTLKMLWFTLMPYHSGVHATLTYALN